MFCSRICRPRWQAQLLRDGRPARRNLRDLSAITPREVRPFALLNVNDKL